MNPNPAGRKWRLRLTLRATMALVLVVAGWMGWRVHRARTQLRAVGVVEGQGGSVRYDYQFPGERSATGRGWVRRPSTEPNAPRWLRRAVGDEFLREVTWAQVEGREPPDPSVWRAIGSFDRLAELRIDVGWDGELTGVSGLRSLRRLRSVSVANDPIIPDSNEPFRIPRLAIDAASLAEIAAIPGLEEIRLAYAKLPDDAMAALAGAEGLTSVSILDPEGLTDAGVARLARLGRLKTLSIIADGTITDRSLRGLRPILPQLGGLVLGRTGITDVGMAELKACSRLKSLNLSSAKITDEGLKSLRGLDQLETLHLGDVAITDAGLASLKDLPALNRLTVQGQRSRVTKAGVDALMAARPALLARIPPFINRQSPPRPPLPKPQVAQPTSGASP